jgi:uncharacterized protein
MTSNGSRLQVVDALRGFAIVSIMLLHNIEHFDFYYTPVGLPAWMQSIDKVIWESLFFLFGGKSYAIFAFLFGLTFFIQSNNQEKRGKDFRGRFAWRLLLLLGFGIINSAFYQGDILAIYAVIGFFLIPVARLSNKAVFRIALVLMFQPYLWIDVFEAFQDPDIKLADPLSWTYFVRMGEYVTGDSFIKTIVGNLTNGKTAVVLWTWENGRVFQTLSLFMLGMLAGRKSLFVTSPENKRFWTRTLIIASISFVPLFIIKSGLGNWIESEAIRRPLLTIETSWSNMAFMFVLVSGFVLLFQTRAFQRVLGIFSPIGRMSLSNYIIQSIIGSFIYYGFGLGLYQYTGATYSILIGVLLAVLQGYFSTWWMKHHTQGPLETIWHKVTWIGSRN